VPITSHELYTVLADVARRQGRITYGDLSQAYFALTGNWYEPHLSWDQPLAQLNQILDALQWPALSAVVVNKATNEPGGGFWASSPSVPQRPTNPLDQTIVWGRILTQVHAAPWPARIPASPPQRGAP
jgi:hypothetical protein